MLLRRLARPMLASSFVYDGVQAALHPAEHATAAREGSALLTQRFGTSPLTESQVMLLVRAHGVATALCGLALAVGKAPRAAALALAALSAPLAVVNQPFTAKGEERQERLAKFARNLGAVGAAVIAGIDLEGRPGITYRLGHAGTAAARTASRTAHDAQTAATLASYRAAKRARKAARDSQRALAAARA